MATIKCLKRTHFIILSKKDYNKSLEDIKIKRRGNLISYLKKISLFSKLTKTFVGKISDNIKEIKVTKDFVLYREGDVADRVYIIKDGEYIVTKKIVSQNQKSEDIKEIKNAPRKANMASNKFFNKNSVK